MLINNKKMEEKIYSCECINIQLLYLFSHSFMN